MDGCGGEPTFCFVKRSGNVGDLKDKESIKKIALDKEINFRYFDDNHIGISLHEKTTLTDLQDIIEIFATAKSKTVNITDWKINATAIPASLQRKSSYLKTLTIHTLIMSKQSFSFLWYVISSSDV